MIRSSASGSQRDCAAAIRVVQRIVDEVRERVTKLIEIDGHGRKIFRRFNDYMDPFVLRAGATVSTAIFNRAAGDSGFFWR